MLKAMPGKVVLVVDEEPEKTAGGIYIPEKDRGKGNTATVLSVGDGVHTLNVEDRVIISKWGGCEVEFEGRPFVILEAKDVLAVIDAVVV